MSTTLAPVVPLPLPTRAIPGTRIRCALPREQTADPCYDFIALWVAHVAFWRRVSRVRRTSNVIRDVQAEFDATDRDEGLTPDPDNAAQAVRWVEAALNAPNSPLSVVRP